MIRFALASTVTVLAGLAASADWRPGDPFKMHFPQLPDPNGWDVNFTSPKALADDWRCTDTGPVSDIHFWFSYERDIVVPIASIQVQIHRDIPAPPGGFSRPGEVLWARNFLPTDFAVRPYGQGDQGWYDPKTDIARRPDHFNFYQANIQEIHTPFIQQVNTIYWLNISVQLVSPTGRIGWKTSRDRFQDDAVWGELPGPIWRELRDPLTDESLDLAFVITPAPGSLAVLFAGGIVAARRRR